jgi:hypothetical protein
MKELPTLRGFRSRRRSITNDRISDTVWLIRRSAVNDRIANNSGLRVMWSEYECEAYEAAALKFDHLYLFANFLPNPTNNSLESKTKLNNLHPPTFTNG